MAKDLPYFKFFCSEWNDGDITLEDYKTQGVFINVCSYYWSNECDITIEKLNKRFKHNQEELTTLFHSGLIKKDEAHIVISFLDEQQQERAETRKVRVKGGKASAEKRRLKKLQQESNTSSTESQHVLKSCSTESQLLREDKIREEEIKEDIIYRSFDHLSLSHEEFSRLEKRWTKKQIDQVLDAIENYDKNKNYKRLDLTAKNWLVKDYPEKVVKLPPIMHWNLDEE